MAGKLLNAATILGAGIDGFFKGMGVGSPNLSALQNFSNYNKTQQTTSPTESRDQAPLDKVYVDAVDRQDSASFRDAIRVINEADRVAATDQIMAIRKLDLGFTKLATFVNGEFAKVRKTTQLHADSINKLSDQNMQLQRRQRALDDQIKFLSLQKNNGKGGVDNTEIDALKRQLAALTAKVDNTPAPSGGIGGGMPTIPWWRRTPKVPATGGAKPPPGGKAPGARGGWRGFLGTMGVMGSEIAGPLGMLQVGDDLAVDTTSKITKEAVSKFGRATVQAARRKYKPWYLGPVGESYYDPDRTNNSNDMEWSARYLAEQSQGASSFKSPNWSLPTGASAQSMDRRTFDRWLQQSQGGVAPGFGRDNYFGSRKGSGFTSASSQISAGGFGGNRTFRPSNATGGARSGSGGVQTSQAVRLMPWEESMQQSLSGAPSGGGSPATATGAFLEPKDNPGVNPEALKVFAGRNLPAAFRTNNPGAFSIAGSNPNPAPGMSLAGRKPGYVGAISRPASEGGYYAKYSTPEHGVNASSELLLSKYNQGHQSIHGIITDGGWADRGQGPYEAAMAKWMGVGINDKLDFSKPEIRAKYLAGASAHEAGSRRGSTMIPLYNDEVFRRGTTGDFLGGKNYSGWNKPLSMDQLLSGKTMPPSTFPLSQKLPNVTEMMKMLKGETGGGTATSSYSNKDVQEASTYLSSISSKYSPSSSTSQNGGAAGAVEGLHPAFRVKLAAAIKEARENGIPDAHAWSMYRSPDMGANPGFAFDSQHARGAAVDMGGIGGAGSAASLKWNEIARKHGVINPYGPSHGAEWNHYQLVPDKKGAGKIPAQRLTGEALRQVWRSTGVPLPEENVPHAQPTNSTQPTSSAPTATNPTRKAAYTEIDYTKQAARQGGAPLAAVKGIIIHNTETPTLDSAVKTLNSRKLAYNIIIDKDGKVYRFTPEGQQGAHATGNSEYNNKNSIGISLIGNNNEDHTPAQIAAAKSVTEAEAIKHNLPPSRVTGHGVVQPLNKKGDEGAIIFKWANSLKEWPSKSSSPLKTETATTTPVTKNLERMSSQGFSAYVFNKKPDLSTEYGAYLTGDRIYSSDSDAARLHGYSSEEMATKGVWGIHLKGPNLIYNKPALEAFGDHGLTSTVSHELGHAGASTGSGRKIGGEIYNKFFPESDHVDFEELRNYLQDEKKIREKQAELGAPNSNLILMANHTKAQIHKIAGNIGQQFGKDPADVIKKAYEYHGAIETEIRKDDIFMKQRKSDASAVEGTKSSMSAGTKGSRLELSSSSGEGVVRNVEGGPDATDVTKPSEKTIEGEGEKKEGESEKKTPEKKEGEGEGEKQQGYGPPDTGGNQSTNFGPSPGSDGYGDDKDSPDNNGGICAI